MASAYQLITLGSLQVEGQAWRPAKALTLLTYLCLEGPTSRRRLRELFWPEARDPGASLRVVLDNFRRHLPGIVGGDETLETGAACDAARLLGLGAAEPASEMADLYAGPFLAGTDLSDVSGELEEWVTERRERLATAARLVALQAAELAGSPAEAEVWAERAMTVAGAPPLDPESLTRLLRLALPGSLLEAELKREQSELGDNPAGQVPTGADPDLLGRERELAGLLLALSDPECRLIEITGAGGIGKSTLAAALLREQADLSGVPLLTVPLETALSSSEAAARMVVALRLQVTDRGDGWLALALAWGERPLLVLLDGAEGLPDLGRGIETLLTECRGVRLIVTSRIQRLSGAVHLALDGLGVPSAGESPDRVARSAAVQLFVRGARRYLPRFILDARSAPVVSAIVRRLGGHPLATVLSATWMRVYPPDQIHTLILQDLTALRAESGSSERHQLSAVFERSWQLLTPQEAQAVAALAVFQGFTAAAALAVASVDEALLGSLGHHSLLREQGLDVLGRRRLEVPPVLAAQAQVHLPDAGTVLDAHAGYYLNHLMTHPPESDEVNGERANIVAALGHAVSQGRDVAQHIDLLLASYDRRGLLDSGTDAFSALREALPDVRSETAGSVLIGLAWLANQSSRRADAEHIAASILDRADIYSDSVLMKAANTMAVSLTNRNDIAGSLTYYQNALHLAGILGDSQRQIRYALNVSVAQRILGNYQESLQAINSVVEKFGGNIPKELSILVEGYTVSVHYYSSALPTQDVRSSLSSFVDKYSDQVLSREYLVIWLLYCDFLLDLGELGEAEGSIGRMERVLKTTETPDIKLANSITKIRLLYLQHKSRLARAEAINALKSIRESNEEDGLCELILACAPDVLRHDAALGLAALQLVTDVLPRSRFQADRANVLRKSITAAAPGSHLSINPNKVEFLDRLESLLGSRHL